MRFLPRLVLLAAVWPLSLAASPLSAVLDRFTAPDVPATGPKEVAQERSWPAEPATPQPAWPGGGLARHDMLYAGEGFNTLFLVRGGKVVWSYSAGRGGEIDDVWLMTNGNILYTRQHSVEEITPQKQVVWHLDASPGTEIHGAQPIGLDKVLIIVNGLPPKLMILEKATNKVVTQHVLPAQSFSNPRTVHAQFRRIRMTGKGTFLVPFLKLHQVVEYDQNLQEVWRYEIPTPWAASRLHNGNTLITNEREKLVREVSPDGKTVWEFKPTDCPPGLVLRNLQTAERLANGNTVIFSSTGGTKAAERPGIIQCVEVTPDKQVVWVLQDWKNLGPATTAQFLNEPGIPEKPGDTQR
jgi:hypothetical protein